MAISLSPLLYALSRRYNNRCPFGTYGTEIGGGREEEEEVVEGGGGEEGSYII